MSSSTAKNASRGANSARDSEKKTQPRGKNVADADPRGTGKALLRSQLFAAEQNLAAHEILFGAIDGFVHSNCNFESSVPVDAAIDEIGKSLNLQDTFATPLRRQLFSMDSALRWVLFLAVAPERAEREGDAPFAPGSFSSPDALALVSQVYDIGVQEAVWDYFDADEGADEGDDEGDTDSETNDK
jgi:hypothetical protein